MVNPINDGVDHINVYSKGATELGRLLTNFAKTSFVHPTFGRFDSVEGAYHFLLTACRHPQFHNLSGIAAKREAKLFPYDKVNKDRPLTSLEKRIICSFIFCKLEQNPYIKELLLQSTLPLEHYYFFGKRDNAKVVELPQFKWMMDYIMNYREHMRNNGNKY